MKSNNLILDLGDVGIHDIHTVGGKNASLGEMINNLGKMGIQIPKGFIVTVEAYHQFISDNGLSEQIATHLKEVDPDDLGSLQACGEAVRTTIMNGQFSDELTRQIEMTYDALSNTYATAEVDVAVRSSSTAEDLPDAS